MYEHRGQPLISHNAFLRRLARHGIFGLVLIVGSLSIGIMGYHLLCHLNWMDAFLNAAMIMGGMGPVDRLVTDASKLFAGLYALYSGLVLLVSVGIFAAPLIHRMLHRFHLEDRS